MNETLECINISDNFYDWFAGLVDGEGCFQIKHQENRWWLEMTISLRDDDRPMLENIREHLGFGHLYLHKIRKPPQNQSKPRYMLRFANKNEVHRLIEIFTHHPLRSKKVTDFKFWAEAFEEISKPAAYRDLERLRFLHDAIRENRKYTNPENRPEVIMPKLRQLRLEHWY
jgi:hypothetical protein